MDLVKRFQYWLVLILLIPACEPRVDNNMQSENVVSVLRVGFPPDQNPAEITRKNKPLLDYLRKKTGIDEIELVVPPSYTATLEDLQSHKLDMVYFGGLTYVLAKNMLKITPLVRGVVDGKTTNQALIIARRDSGIKSLSDLTGLRFAFGDIASTSGHLIPHQALLAAGINPWKDFDGLIFTGAQDKLVYAVQNGDVAAGAMSAWLYPRLIKTGQLQESDIVVIWKSEPFADYSWAIRSDLDSKLISKIRGAFVELHDENLLNLLGIEGYRITNDSDFDNIRTAAIKLGFLQEDGEQD